MLSNHIVFAKKLVSDYIHRRLAAAHSGIFHFSFSYSKI